MTRNPTAEWLARQITEAFPWDSAPKYLIRDNDRAFAGVFKARVRAMGIRDRPTSVRAPWQNGYVERLIGSVRRECTDHLIVFSEEHLRQILAKYSTYYNEACLSGCHPQPLAVVFGHAHGHSPAWQSSVPTIAPRVPATFSRRRGLRRLPGEGSLERRVCLPPLSAEEYLPIIHLVFANLKTWLNGIHHGVSHQHLQAYLNEFTFRFNKRFYPFNAFRSLLGIAGDVTAPYLRRALLRSLAASYM